MFYSLQASKFVAKSVEEEKKLEASVTMNFSSTSLERERERERERVPGGRETAAAQLYAPNHRGKRRRGIGNIPGPVHIGC